MSEDSERNMLGSETPYKYTTIGHSPRKQIPARDPPATTSLLVAGPKCVLGSGYESGKN
jgi:hypothetical protein